MIASDEYRPRRKNTRPNRRKWHIHEYECKNGCTNDPNNAIIKPLTLPSFDIYEEPRTLQADLDALYYLQHKPDVLKGKYGKPFSTMGLEGRAGIDRIKSKTKAVIKRWRPQ